ncbi:hypothetical protein E4T56_gene5619 [Termitomyces sp. T112]|nr:hypothetical protein E4T56_gene5619 [Termitomyces sp. T112]KAH0588254.1 hypothetical protein H2248_006962 [Termitomyces sp. 'cryptogamus']KNZ72588.1 hypothetical protein J132_02589 [Termitomyces sp. J132]
MSYTNPLHPPVHSSQISRYTSLEGAVGSSKFLSPTRRRLPQPSYTPASKWDLAMGQNARRHAAIQFDYVGYNGQGVQMRELSARSDAAIASMIQGAGDPVLAHAGRERVTFRIIWPGYEHVESCDQIIINPGGRPITRAQLGKFVAQIFARFVEKTRTETSRSSQWNLTSSGIRFEHLVLVALVNVWEGVWQADVAVDLR